MTAPDTIILAHRCRLQPTRQQRRALEAILEQQRQLQNAALEEREAAYRASDRLTVAAIVPEARLQHDTPVLSPSAEAAP